MKKKQSTVTRSNSQRLVIEESRGVFLGKGIALSIFLGLLLFGMANQYLPGSSLFQWHFIGLIVLATAFTGLVFYCFWKVTSPAILAILDQEGVWLKKQGLIPWKDVEEYSSKYRYNRYWSVSEVYLVTTGRKITIDLSLTEVSTEVVEWYLQRLKNRKQVIKDKE
jgi:hypothetical protein